MSDWKPEFDSVERQADYLVSLKIAERLAQDTLPKTQRKGQEEQMGDLISRQAALEALCKTCYMMADYHKCNGYPDGSTWCDDRVAIRNLPSVEAVPKWIPVSEKLPKDDEEVIVSCTDDSGDTPFSYTTVAWHFKGTWICKDERCFFITAWMPLPEPYKGEE